MEKLYSVLVLPLSPIIALIADSYFKTRLTRTAAIALVFLCCLIAAPLLFTDYSYGGFYSYWFVIAVISAILLFVIFNFLRLRRTLKLAIIFGLVIIFLIPAGLTIYARGFAGDDKIYDVQRIRGYKIIYKRKADAVLHGPLKVELYKTILFGLLQKQVDADYVDVYNGPCVIKLRGSAKRIIEYDFCKRTIR